MNVLERHRDDDHAHTQAINPPLEFRTDLGFHTPAAFGEEVRKRPTSDLGAGDGFRQEGDRSIEVGEREGSRATPRGVSKCDTERIASPRRTDRRR